MFKRFYPTSYTKNVYAVDFADLYNKKYRNLILDIDNTLVEHGADADSNVISFFESLRGIGFNTCIISNNNEERVKPFAEAVKSCYLCNAQKPNKKAYIGAMQRLGGDSSNTIFIGDQLFTDIFGSNNAGIKSILVKPIKIDPHFYIRLKRLGERIVLPFYFRYAKKHPEKFSL